MCIPGEAHLHSRWGHALPVRHIPIYGEDVHSLWGTSPFLVRHILTGNGNVSHRECTSSPGMHILTRNGNVPHRECTYDFGVNKAQYLAYVYIIWSLVFKANTLSYTAKCHYELVLDFKVKLSKELDKNSDGNDSKSLVTLIMIMKGHTKFHLFSCVTPPPLSLGQNIDVMISSSPLGI